MSANDKFSEVKKLREDAQDTTLAVELRLEKVKDLLKLLPSGNNITLAKRYCKQLASVVGVPDETKKKIAKELGKIKGGHYTRAEPDDRSDTEDAPVFNVVENLNLGSTLEEALAYRNKDVRANPPAKFIYFPRDQRNYLTEHYADLYAPFGYKTTVAEIDESFFEDEYNNLPAAGSQFHRSLNPAWLKAYVEWKREKFGDTLPSRQSIYFYMFCNEEEVRRWAKLGTLSTPSEQPIGGELRKRLLRSGEIKRWELPFLWNIHWALLLNRTGKYWVREGDIPIQCLIEFLGIEKTQATGAETQDVRRKVLPPSSASTQPERSVNVTVNAVVGPRYGLPEEVCGYCRGFPKSEVPSHDCMVHMIPKDTADWLRVKPAASTQAVPDPEIERIKTRIRQQGYGDAIFSDGSGVEFDCRKISFQEWARQNPE